MTETFNFQVGDKVRIVKPENPREHPSWVGSMGTLLGRVFEVAAFAQDFGCPQYGKGCPDCVILDEPGKRKEVSEYKKQFGRTRFNKKWLIPAEVEYYHRFNKKWFVPAEVEYAIEAAEAAEAVRESIAKLRRDAKPVFISSSYVPPTTWGKPVSKPVERELEQVQGWDIVHTQRGAAYLWGKVLVYKSDGMHLVHIDDGAPGPT